MSLLLDLCPKPLSTPAESSEASAEAELFVSEFLETGAGEHDRGGGDRGDAYVMLWDNAGTSDQYRANIGFLFCAVCNGGP